MLNLKSIVAVMAILPLGLVAQKDVVSAYNANKDGDYLKAAEFIDQAILDSKANVKEKTWRYRGNIYTNIASDSVLYAQVPDALEKAAMSLAKAEELDVKSRYDDERKADIARGASIAGNAGISYFNNGVYGRAGELFVTSSKLTMALGAVDTMAIFNSALCFEKAAMYDRAVDQYMMCGGYGYQVPDVFLFAANIQKMEGDTAKALTTLQNARQDFPREQALIIEELNIYLVGGQFELAKENLMLAAEQDPTNEILWFSLGSVYDNLGMTDEAVEAYAKSLEIKPDYFDANYNLGALYFNKAVQMVNEANDMWKPRMSSDESTKQKELEEGGKAMFSTALPYLEHALEVEPDDRETLRSLRDIYARVGMDEKMLEVSTKLKTLE
ncbi:MAG: tetratricopeptide repeat protein [Crocinitomicaceae bacterium TMED114]|nr:MAG: tetratricopeptide repeat protein [Crocinitomicaceae bacterium TMED114]